MTSATSDTGLGGRMRELRSGVGLTQRKLSDALGSLSPSLISSWERGTAVPSERWLAAFARIIADRDTSIDGAELEAELLSLRAAAPTTTVSRPASAPAARRLRGFWAFTDDRPDPLPIRVIGTPMFPRWLERIDYADPWHPNYIHSLRNADMDATITVIRRIDAANPDHDVRYLTQDEMKDDDLTGHVVLLGGVDVSLSSGNAGGAADSILASFLKEAKVPVFSRLRAGADPEFDAEFVVTTDASGRPARGGKSEEVYAAEFVTESGKRVLEHGFPRLEHDVGLLLRQANPRNPAATLTICSGIFSRGTYGAVRMFTDRQMRERNETILHEKYDPSRFWVLIKVPVAPTYAGRGGLTTVTPHLDVHLLRGNT
jgi:transcriptional regulator with XRE-family HTH domain